jgi:hypothetical protein
LLLPWIAAHYGLIALAMRDLLRRPAVRGGNPVAWGLVILGVPIAGPLAYAALHPGVLPARPPRPRPARRPRRAALSAGTCPAGVCPPDPATADPATPRRRLPGLLDHRLRRR